MNLNYIRRFLFEVEPEANGGGGNIDFSDANPYLTGDQGTGADWKQEAAPASPVKEETTTDKVTDPISEMKSLNPKPAEKDDDEPQQPVPGEQMRESRKILRGKLDEAQAKLSQMEAAGQETSAKYQEAEKRIEALQKQLEERDAQYVTKAVPDYDPQKDADLQSIGKVIGTRVSQTVAFLHSGQARAIVNEQLPNMMDGFNHHVARGNIAPFREMLMERLFTKEQMEEAPEKCEQDVNEILQMCRSLLPEHVRYQETLQKNQQTWDARRESFYTETRQSAEKSLRSITEWSQDQIKANPQHPAAIISGMVAANPAIKAEIDELVKAHVEMQAGPKPLPRNPTKQQIAEHRAFEQKVKAVRAKSIENAFYMQVLPNVTAHLYETVQKLQKRVGSAVPGNRPETSQQSDGKKTDPDFQIQPGQSINDVKNPYLK